MCINERLDKRRTPLLRDELKRHFDTYVDKMTQGERAAAYASGEEADHIPYSIQSNEEAMANVFGYTTAQWRDDPKVHIDVIRRRRDEFGIVGLAAGLRLRTVGQAVGTRMFFPEVGIDRVVEPAVQTPADMKRVLDVDPYTSPVYQAILERGRILKDAFPEMGIGTSVAGPITVAAMIMPTDLMLRNTRKNPAMVRELLELAVYHSVAWAEMFAQEFGGAPCTICDPVSCADIISRKQYVEFSLPYQQKLVEGLTKAMGRKPGLHICGKTNTLWDDMRNLDVVSFSVDNRESLEEAKRRMGDRFVLVGNVDPVDVMMSGSPADVVEACKNCIRQGSESPLGYNLGTGCQVPIGTPRENFEAFVYAARIYGAHARKGQLPKGMLEYA
ncbi:MAG: uroporphyrinogen decarboxylase family protein [Eggerthellaceae bacterium]|nr:uroporphyrinogen decarboxylase family protein [Eggerthellaceae bacterium]